MTTRPLRAGGSSPSPASPASPSRSGKGGAPGSHAVGRYRLCEELAAGGMGTVHLAKLEGTAGFEKVVAVKVIHPHLAAQPDTLAMFLDEARIASQINHPNVCQIFDFGAEGQTHYIAMEYLMGETVSALMRAVHQVPALLEEPRFLRFVARIGHDACEGLHSAHELTDPHGRPLAVVHRDISPQNLFVTYAGSTKILDFGIAYAKYKSHKTQTGELKGNLAYIAPEQIRGLEVDRRCDLWSLGVVLWELLAGQRLFGRGHSAETIHAVLDGEVTPLARLRPRLPAALAAAVARALERDPGRRFGHAREMGRALEAAVSELGGMASSAEISEWMDELFPGGSHRQRERLSRASLVSGADAPDEATTKVLVRRRRRPRLWFGAAAAVAMTLGGVLLGWQAGGAAGSAEGSGPEEPVTDTPPAVRSGAQPGPAGPATAATAEELRSPASPDEGEQADAPPPDERPTPAPAPVDEQADPAPAPVDEQADPAPDEQAAEPSRRPSRAAPTRRTRTGQLNLVTPGGWAYVYDGRRLLGQTPLRKRLPVGKHVLELRPFGREPGRPVRVRVRAAGVARVVVPVER